MILSDDIPDDFEEIAADDNNAEKIDDEEVEDLFDDGEELKELNF